MCYSRYISELINDEEMEKGIELPETIAERLLNLLMENLQWISEYSVVGIGRENGK